MPQMTPGADAAAGGGAEEGRRPRELRATALTALALALLAVAGLASSVSPWRGSGGATAPSSAFQALAAVGGVVLVVALLVLWVETPATWRTREKKRRLPAADELDELSGGVWTAGKTAAIVMVALAVFCIATLPLLTRDDASSHAPTARPSAGAAAQPRAAGNGSSARSIDLGWLLVPIAVTTAIAAPAAVLIRRRRLARDRAVHPDDAAALGRAVRASIAALESERDPRLAILRAYERMEEAFESVEIVRGRDETASEFLGRTTRRLPVSADAATALTERFEEVRYSTHEITEADREDALGSLQRVERELGKRP
jgi:hypothetical protein